jgi:hypothetical protein
LVKQAKQLDDHFALGFGLYNAMRADMIELNRLGAGPQINLVDVMCKRALETASLRTRLALAQVAPLDRVTFAELATSWAKNIATGAQAPEKQTVKEKEAA